MARSSCVLFVDRKSESLENRYDPERDTIPGGPSVTWADSQLLDLIKYLASVIDFLREEIAELKEGE